jgi:hypothetical protein
MKIGAYSIHPENYHKRTPVTLKKVADILLATILVVDPLMLSIPDFQGKEWVTWGWNALCVIFKLISKFITDDRNL